MKHFCPWLALSSAGRFSKGTAGDRFGRAAPSRSIRSTRSVQALFADPLHPPASASKLATTGVNRDGWLDLAKGPLVLHVPGMAGRYYSVQFTDPSNNTNFAYVGKRATGTEAGDYLVSGPGWKGTMPQGITQISSPNNSVLVIGRVFVESESDISTANDLACCLPHRLG